MLSIVRRADSDLPAVKQFWKTRWGDDFVVVHGQVFKPEHLDGFIAIESGDWLGLITFYFDAFDCEIVSLDSLRPGCGIGTALLKAVESAARKAGCRVLKLVTTNDNTPALRFYQKYGFEMVALRRLAVIESRKIKPSIPEFGLDQIPIRDELDMELRFPPPNPDLCT
jgi:ribosomal protein S18 acetylase RimI-like enzyme